MTITQKKPTKGKHDKEEVTEKDNAEEIFKEQKRQAEKEIKEIKK